MRGLPCDNDPMSLQQELHQLRESTRSALMESWAEVEHLQQENSTFQEKTHHLETQLEESREREAKTQQTILDLQKKLQEAQQMRSSGNVSRQPSPLRALLLPSINKSSHGTNDASNDLEGGTTNLSASPITNGSFSAKRRSLNSFLMQRSRSTRNLGTTRMEVGNKSNSNVCDLSSTASESTTGTSPPPPLSRMRRSRSSDISSLMSDPALEADSSNSKWNLIPKRRGSYTQQQQQRNDMLEEELLCQMREFEQKKNELLAEYKVKLDCRDSAIQSMEQTTQIQGESLEQLRHELKHTKSKAISNEKALLRQVDQLKKKLNEKRKIILKQQTKMDNFQSFIAQLTDELDRAKAKKNKEQQ